MSVSSRKDYNCMRSRSAEVTLVSARLRGPEGGGMSPSGGRQARDGSRACMHSWSGIAAAPASSTSSCRFGTDRRVCRASRRLVVRRRERSSRPLAAMERSAARVTIQSMSVKCSTSRTRRHSPPPGSHPGFHYHRGRKKIIESVYALFGDEPDQTAITVSAGLYLLERVAPTSTTTTPLRDRGQRLVNATLAFQKAESKTRRVRRGRGRSP